MYLLSTVLKKKILFYQVLFFKLSKIEYGLKKQPFFFFQVYFAHHFLIQSFTYVGRCEKKN